MIRDWVEPATEDPRACFRRRIQQQRCLVCGSRQIRPSSYFCVTHIATHCFCSICETLRLKAPNEQRERRCKACRAVRALADYYRNPERTNYRTHLRQIQERRLTRSEQLFVRLRERIALADLVAKTPGWTWPERAQLVGHNATAMAATYRAQCRGAYQDVDAAERAGKKRQPRKAMP